MRRRGSRGRCRRRPRAAASSTHPAADSRAAAGLAGPRSIRSPGRSAWRPGAAGSRCRLPPRRPGRACGRPRSRSARTRPCRARPEPARVGSSGRISTGRGRVSHERHQRAELLRSRSASTLAVRRVRPAAWPAPSSGCPGRARWRRRRRRTLPAWRTAPSSRTCRSDRPADSRGRPGGTPSRSTAVSSLPMTCHDRCRLWCTMLLRRDPVDPARAEQGRRVDALDAHRVEVP